MTKKVDFETLKTNNEKLLVKKSSIKIDKDGFNSCPSRKDLIKFLRTTKIKYIPVDICNVEDWSNEFDTFVLEIEEGDFSNLLKIARMAKIWFSDEFDYYEQGNKVFIRLWWD